MAENFFGNTDTGRMRDNNEDAFIAEKVWNGDMIAACVIDGVGGYEGGEIAAGIARDTILQYLQSGDGEVMTVMKDALRVANDKIYQQKTENKEHQSMACVLTLALADIKNNQFYYVHIGDTRLYLLRDHSLVKVTKDHSFVGYLEDSKRLSETEAMRHPKRNEINKALGFDPQMSRQPDYMESGQSPFLPGDMLLLCSDGLTDLVNSSSITGILNSKTSLEEKTTALIDAANNAGGKDNITVVLVQNDKKPVQLRATKPTLKKKDEQKIAEQVVEKKDPPLIIQSSKKSGTGLTIFLAVLSMALIAVVLWLWFKQKSPEIEPVVTPVYQKAAAEQNLINTISRATGNEVILADSATAGTVVLTDTIFIDRDTLHLIGNGITLRRDSSYNGPAIVLSPNTKFVVLDNIVLQDFNVGIIARPKALYLIHVKFNNCSIPVLTQHQFPSGIFLNAQIADSISFNYDTLQKR